MKKLISYTLIIIGFLWITGACFSSVGYAQWIYHSKQLPETEMITRADAVSEMRNFQLDSDNFRQALLIPALLMLLGGVANVRRQTKKAIPVNRQDA